MSRRRAEPEVEKENSERWIVSYADMLTLLFAVFVVLYAVSDTNERKLQEVRTSIDQAFRIGVLTSSDGASPVFEGGGGLAPSLAEIQSRDIARISDRLSMFTRDIADGHRIQIRADESSITVSLLDDLLFASGSADLRPGSQEVLLALSAQLAGMPNNIRVEGHTDNVPVNHPDFPTNWELSAARANTVLRFLIEEGGLEPERLSTAGFAETRPIGDNDTPEGRALNRRADIVILYPTVEDLIDILQPGGETQP
jgi:chemotaxis protein MotB